MGKIEKYSDFKDKEVIKAKILEMPIRQKPSCLCVSL